MEIKRNIYVTHTQWNQFSIQQKLIHCKSSMLLFSVAQSHLTYAIPWIVAQQAPLSMRFPGKNPGVSCHFLPQGISDPGMETRSPVLPVSPVLKVDSSPTESTAVQFAKSLRSSWTAACQASPSFTISWSLFKFMSIGSVMPSNHLILFSAFSPSQHQGLFQWVGSLNHVAKVLELQVQHQSFQWIFRVNFRLTGLISL